MTGWELFESGRYEEAIRQLKEDCKRRDRAPDLGTAPVALMLLGRIADAQKAYERLIVDDSNSARWFHRSGVVAWMTGKYKRAVSLWQQALKCGYSDGGRGVHAPLLLYFAGVRRPRLFDASESMRMIESRAGHGPQDIWNWPRPLGWLVLGDVDEIELRSRLESDPQPYTPYFLHQVDFYLGVLALAQGDRRRYREKMEQCAVLIAPQCAFNEEYFLAQAEIATIRRSGKTDN